MTQRQLTSIERIENENMSIYIQKGRIWLDLILKKELNMVVDWSAVDKEDYLLAMERSPIKDIEIKYILNL